MKKTLLLAAMLALPMLAQAQNIIKVFAPITASPGRWVAAEPAYSDWNVSGAEYGCGNWTPGVDGVLYGTKFTQTMTCSQDSQRTAQSREYNDLTKAYRLVGTPQTETKTSPTSKQQQATGTAECGYSLGAPATYWYVYKYTTAYSKEVHFNGSTIWSGTDTSSSKVINGVTYRRGTLMLTQNISNYTNLYYQVCATK